MNETLLASIASCCSKNSWIWTWFHCCKALRSSLSPFVVWPYFSGRPRLEIKWHRAMTKDSVSIECDFFQETSSKSQEAIFYKRVKFVDIATLLHCNMFLSCVPSVTCQSVCMSSLKLWCCTYLIMTSPASLILHTVKGAISPAQHALVA